MGTKLNLWWNGKSYHRRAVSRELHKQCFMIFLNCDNHSLNLVGVTAAQQEPIVVTCFGIIENIYLFFSSSTLRWELLSQTGIFSDSRLTISHDGVPEYKRLALLWIASIPTTTSDIRIFNSVQNILTFSFITLVHFWY